MSDGHYRQELHRGLTVLTNVAITLSGVTPASSVFVIIPVLFVLVGSGTFLALLIAAAICLAMSLCWAELGAAYPIAGGDYSLVQRVLGPAAGFLALVLSGPVQAILIPSVIALGMSQYLHVIVESDPDVVAAVVMVVATAIAMLGIRLNAWITSTFLAFELISLLVVSVLGFAHVNRPFGDLLSPQAGHGALSPVSAGLLLSGVAVAIFAYNGYQSPVSFAEETHGPRRRIAQAILWSLAITVVAELVPTTAALLGAPSLPAMFAASSPMQYLVTQLGGTTLNTIVSLVVAAAIFNAVIAIILFFARILYSSGRDLTWPVPLSRALATVHPRARTPWVATAAIGVVGAVLVLTTDVVTLSTWTGVALAIDYALIAAAAFLSRITQRDLARPYRMPLWPLAPLFALAGCIVTLTKQSASDLRVAAIVVLVSLAYYALYLRGREDRFLMLNPIREDD